jgi:hypothetical protein
MDVDIDILIENTVFCEMVSRPPVYVLCLFRFSSGDYGLPSNYLITAFIFAILAGSRLFIIIPR